MADTDKQDPLSWIAVVATLGSVLAISVAVLNEFGLVMGLRLGPGLPVLPTTLADHLPSASWLLPIILFALLVRVAQVAEMAHGEEKAVEQTTAMAEDDQSTQEARKPNSDGESQHGSLQRLLSGCLGALVFAFLRFVVWVLRVTTPERAEKFVFGLLILSVIVAFATRGEAVPLLIVPVVGLLLVKWLLVRPFTKHLPGSWSALLSIAITMLFLSTALGFVEGRWALVNPNASHVIYLEHGRPVEVVLVRSYSKILLAVDPATHRVKMVNWDMVEGLESIAGYRGWFGLWGEPPMLDPRRESSR